MCMVSVTADDFLKSTPGIWPTPAAYTLGPSREEFEALKRRVEKLAEDLEAAKKIDEANGDTDCEHEDKIAIIKEIADMLGVELPI